MQKYSRTTKPISQFIARPHIVIDGCLQVAAFVLREDAKEYVRTLGGKRMRIISVKKAETR